MSSALAHVPNLLALSLQIACVVLTAALMGAILRVRRPEIGYAFWRVVLALCLILPWIQTPRRVAAAVTGAVNTALPVSAAAPSAIATGAAPIDWTFWAAMLIAAGVFVRLTWIVIGFLRLRHLRTVGETVRTNECAELLQALRVEADIRDADAVRQPVTFGLFRPVVLLPSTLRDYPVETRRAILAHELLHVKRRDWCSVVIEEFLRTVFWFNPAMWWLISQVQHVREEVIDATVVTLTGRRREYVEALIAFSDAVPLAPASAFARRRHLFRRIVLLSTEDAMSVRRLVVSVLVMMVAVLAAGATAVRAFPLLLEAASIANQSTLATLLQPASSQEQSAKPATPENPIPKRIYGENPAFPLTADGEDTSVTVTLRIVVDEAGNVASQRLAGFAFRRGGISATVPPSGFNQFLGNAQFKDSDGIVITAESLRPMFEAAIESAADAVQRWRYEPPTDGPLVFNVVIHFSNGKATTSDMLAAARTTITPDGAVRVGGNVRPPVKIRDVKPVYPQQAREGRVQGVVIAEVRIEPDGTVGHAQILRSIPLLDEAALEAVRQWQFVPTLLNGVAVPVIMTVTVQFSLQ